MTRGRHNLHPVSTLTPCLIIFQTVWVHDKPSLFLRGSTPLHPFLGIRSTRRPNSHLFRQEILTISLKLSSFFPSPLLSSISSPNSTLLCTMVRKLGPRRGARSSASSRPIPADSAVAQSERRSKRRNDPTEQPGSSSAPQRTAKRGRASSSGRGSNPTNPRPEIPDESSENPEESSSSSYESSESQEDIPSESVSAAKSILKPRILDLSDIQLAASFPEIQTYFSFQSWLPFISEFHVSYPRLVREFYKNLKCTDEGFESKVKGIAIDMPTATAASIFKVPDEGEDYHEFEFDLHEAYSILTGLPADASDPKQTHVTRFNANSFPPVLRVIHHILTTIITPQGGGRDRLTDIQRFILYCMVKDIKINLHVILYQIISETTRTDLKRSLPYAAHLTSVFQHFGVPLENEKSQSIPKSNIYTFKNIQKFMGFRLEGYQIRRGPVVVEAPQAQEEQPQDQGEQHQAQEDQPQVQTFLCKRCVDTPINGVDTTTQIQRQNVDTLSEQVDTRPSSQNSQFEELGQQIDTLPEQVNTRPSSQNSIFHNLDSVSTPPPGQVDTLREVFILKWMGATCQPRPMGINLGSCALIPKRL
ncbi:hypothetical protein Taro_000318 [Colocasia esculenta]|uniref:Putative plant transposon protein domain-containing protein n=1 Tax=Colocasia esculenta TaxID=4460 RepID=A0A843TG75_COLES|nr:hypothetical protein [Colocasia esculenta]